MARNSRSSSSRSHAARSRSSSSSSRQPAVHTQPQQAVQPASAPVKQPGLFAQMATTAAGVAAGSAVGHTLGAGLSSMFGGNSSPQHVQEPQHQNQDNSVCAADQKAFMKCLESNESDISKCQFYLDMYKQCQQGQVQQWN